MSVRHLNNQKQKTHFLHIGKTGGSAVKSVLEDFQETPKYSLSLHDHFTYLKDVPRGHSVVFFLRDPITRFVSAFYSRQRKGQPLYFYEWTHEEEQIFSKYSTPNELATSLASGHGFAIEAMKCIQHFRNYNNWYSDFEYFNTRIDDILFVGFQETLNSDFTKLKRVLEIPEHINLPTDDVTAHKSPVNLDRSIGSRGKAALREWYSEDIQFLEICKKIMSNRTSADKT